ncbi:MAG: pyridoxal-phosphate dependent enzyme, partial [Bacteroidota bacterium]
RISGMGEANSAVWIKREDESGFGISGSKRRKYASLLPYLIQEQFALVGLIGGSNSNHLVGISQLLIEKQIPFHVFIKESKGPIVGNRWLLDLLVSSEQITIIPPELPWQHTYEWAEQQLRAMASPSWLIPEGGTSAAALPGLLTLGHEIRQQEIEMGTSFDHIWIDAGTGGMAAALAHSLALTQHPGHLHVVLTAGNEAEFTQIFNQTGEWIVREKWGIEAPPIHQPVLHPPFTARAFGSVNATIRQTVRTLARQHGLLCDPVYTAKLLGTAQSVIEEGLYTGHHLIIHTGGGTGLMGFAGRW